MKVVLVHDYIKEYGGAERVLKVLTEMYPKAPIYTAFRVKKSTAGKKFRGSIIKESFLSPILKLYKLYSPLRFLIPVIWSSFDLREYDLVIVSSSWYDIRNLKVSKKAKVVIYCHTPPRWLYGYDMSVGFTKYLPVKIYALIVGHILRMWDFSKSQKINYWIANSNNVRTRIEKYYRKDSTVIYPPCDVENIIAVAKKYTKEDYFLIVSRLVGAKGIEEAAEAASILNFNLKIVGEAHGYSDEASKLKKLSGGNIEIIGRVEDNKLYELYAKAKCFIALAQDEDFGMTVVEAQASGTPVIAFNGGGFRESVIDGVTGVLINDIKIETISKAINKISTTKWDKQKLQDNAKKFSKENFILSLNNYVKKIASQGEALRG